MSFSTVNHLKRAIALANGAQTIEIGEKQVGALVGGGAAGESERERGLAEFRARGALDFREHLALGGQMRPLDFVQADADGMTQIQIVASPLGNAPVE